LACSTEYFPVSGFGSKWENGRNLRVKSAKIREYIERMCHLSPTGHEIGVDDLNIPDRW